MSKKKELNQEQLDRVNGGGWFGHLLDSAKDTVKEANNNAIEDNNSK